MKLMIITILTTVIVLSINIQEIESLFCYSCFSPPHQNNVYPTALPCPGVIEFSLMNVVSCDDVNNSCVMFTERNGDVEYPVSAGCSWRRIAPEKQTSYVRNCQKCRCENFCATDYCRYKWP